MMEIEQVLGDGESQAESAELPRNRGLTLFESIEKRLSPRWLNPNPGICDLKDKVSILIVARLDLELPGWSGELGCIVDQIPKYLLDAYGVRSNKVPLRLKYRGYLELFFVDLLDGHLQRIIDGCMRVH